MAFREKLRDYCVKTRNNASWPGTPGTYSNDFKYRVCFYKTNLDTKKLLAEAGHLYGFDGETFPQDLAFFRGNWCFLYTTVHEELSTIVHPQKPDIKFMIEQGISYTKQEYRNPEVAERKYAEELWKNGIPYELNVEARKKLWEELDSCLFEKLVNDEVKT